MCSNFRSNDNNEHLLIIPCVKYKTFAARTFNVIGPMFWNKLLSRIKSSATCEGFKKDLKTYLFTKYVINSMDTCLLYYICNFIIIIAIVLYILYSKVDTLAVQS